MQATRPAVAPAHQHHRQAVRRQAQRQHWHFYTLRPDWHFIHNFTRAPIRWGGERGVLLGLAALLGVLAFVVLPGWSSALPAASIDSPSLVAREIALPRLPEAPVSALVAAVAEPEWTSVEVRKGQTMGEIFATLGLSAQVLHGVIDTSPHGAALTRIRPGQRFEFQRDASGALLGLRFDSGDTERVVMRLDDGKTHEEIIAKPVERRVRLATGTIRHSLFADGEAAGLSDPMIMQMATIFGYDIDFAQDLQRGDHFAVVYEELYQDGERLRDGNILTASFTNNGHRYTATRFAADGAQADYFDADGRVMRKTFLRTPVAFTRISSKFSSGRMHPILGKMRAHRGVDYATPAGTPIKAAGDGKVVYRGWKSGYGNCVILEHGGKYSTLYGHMSRFATARVGSRVRQGETIGYVGMTGLATAPHLHFEFRVDGAHRDPLTVAMPKAEPLTGAALAAFRRATQGLVAKLDLIEQRTNPIAQR